MQSDADVTHFFNRAADDAAYCPRIGGRCPVDLEPRLIEGPHRCLAVEPTFAEATQEPLIAKPDKLPAGLRLSLQAALLELIVALVATGVDISSLPS